MGGPKGPPTILLLSRRNTNKQRKTIPIQLSIPTTLVQVSPTSGAPPLPSPTPLPPAPPSPVASMVKQKKGAKSLGERCRRHPPWWSWRKYATINTGARCVSSTIHRQFRRKHTTVHAPSKELPAIIFCGIFLRVFFPRIFQEEFPAVFFPAYFFPADFFLRNLWRTLQPSFMGETSAEIYFRRSKSFFFVFACFVSLVIITTFRGLGALRQPSRRAQLPPPTG